jgi:hypothetical protein
MHISTKIYTFIPNELGMLVANMSPSLMFMLWRIIRLLPAVDFRYTIHKNSKKSNIMSQNSCAHVILHCKHILTDLYLVHIHVLMTLFYTNIPLTPLYSHYTLLHVSALKGPSSASTDTCNSTPWRWHLGDWNM